MDKSEQVMQLFARMRAAPTAEAIEAEHAAGVAAAKAAIAANASFHLLDENHFDECKKAYAAGWNRTWFIATQANM